MDKMDLSDFFKTKAQATDFSARITKVSAQIYQTGFNLEAALLTEFGLQKKDKFLRLMRDSNVTPTQGSLKEFFAKLQEAVSKLPTLSITLAFEPTEQTLKSLSEWCVMNIGKQMLFDLHVDPKLIAGIIIQHNGKHLDLSVRPKVEQVLSQQLFQPVKPAVVQPVSPPPSPSQPAAHHPDHHMAVGG